MKLNNIKSVFISGASKGIGFELAKQYLTTTILMFFVWQEIQHQLQSEQKNKI